MSPTDEELTTRYPWTLHRRMQLQGGQDLGPCTCDFCAGIRRKRWAKEHS